MARRVTEIKSLARTCRAFTLIEVLLVIVVLGIVSGIGFPIVSGVVDSSRRSSALVAARSVNAAQMSYALIVPTAQANWNNAASDTARLQLLIDANLLPGSPSDFLTTPGGYTLQLAGNLRGNSVLMYNGSSVTY